MNTIQRQSQYARIPEFLLMAIRCFNESPEYRRLSPDERALPGAVGASLAHLIARLQRAELDHGGTEADRETLASAYDCLEVFSSSQDHEVKTFVESDVFGNIRASDDLWQAIARRLGRRARALLEARRACVAECPTKL